jgi:hypothetical protein
MRRVSRLCASQAFSPWGLPISVVLCGSSISVLSTLVWLGFESWNAAPVELAFEYQVPEDYPEHLHDREDHK